MTDAGADTSPPPAIQVLAPVEPAEAADPAPPIFAGCPAGWTTGDDGETCSPYVADARPSTCDASSFQPPGEPSCVPVGTACPAGDWPEDIPAGATTVYVRASASTGGSGTRDSPFSTISAGIAAVSAGGVVVVAKGTYPEAIRVSSGITVVGACAAETFIDPPMLRLQAVTVQGTDVVLRNLRIRSAGEIISARGASASFLAEGLVLAEANGRCILLADGATATVRGVAMRDALAGIVAETGATATVERSVIERAFDAAVSTTGDASHIVVESVRIGETRRTTGTFVNAAVSAQSGSLVEVRNSVVSASARNAIKADTMGVVSLSGSLVQSVLGVSTADGYAFEASLGGIIRAERVRIEDAAGAAVVVNGGDSFVEIVDSVIRGAASPDGPEHDSEGAYVRAGGRLTLERSRVSGFRTGGIAVLGEGATLVATDVVIHDMRGTLEGGLGRGLEIGRGGRAELRRVRIERARELGILLIGLGSNLLAEDLVIAGTREQASDLHSGRALQVQDGAVADLLRARFEDNLDLVLAVRDEGTTVSATDLVIERVGEDVGEGRFGRGLELILGADVRLRRARIAEATEVAVLVEGAGTELDAEDVSVVATRARSADGAFGRGIEVIAGGRLTLARAVLDANHDAALSASGEGTTVEFVDVEVVGTMAATCDACVAGVSGLGVGATGGASVALRRFIVRDHAALGLQVADGGSLDLAAGQVTGCPIGANVAIEGYDVRRLLAPDVVFRDNARDLSLDAIGTLPPLERRD